MGLDLYRARVMKNAIFVITAGSLVFLPSFLTWGFVSTAVFERLPKCRLPKRGEGFARQAIAPAGLDTAATAQPDTQQRVLNSLRTDLLNPYIWDEGFVYTPFALDIEYADPLVHTYGRLPYQLFLTGRMTGIKSFLNPNTLKLEVQGMRLVDGFFNPFGDCAFPPRLDSAPSRRSGFAVDFQWEVRGEGRVKIRGFMEQKPFVLSGRDVVRFDGKGKAFRIESGWDQSPMTVLAYFNPLAHMSPLDTMLPIFKDSIPLPVGPSVDTVMRNAIFAVQELVKEWPENTLRKPYPLAYSTGAAVVVSPIQNEENRYVEFVWLIETQTGRIIAAKYFDENDPHPPVMGVTVKKGTEVIPMLYTQAYGVSKGDAFVVT